MLLRLWVHKPKVVFITPDASASVSSLWFALSRDGSALCDILDAFKSSFPNIPGCFSFFQVVFIPFSVTILSRLRLNAISFPTICWFQLPLTPHGWWQCGLTLLSPHHMPELGDSRHDIPCPRSTKSYAPARITALHFCAVTDLCRSPWMTEMLLLTRLPYKTDPITQKCCSSTLSDVTDSTLYSWCLVWFVFTFYHSLLHTISQYSVFQTESGCLSLDTVHIRSRGGSLLWGFPGGSVAKNLPANAGVARNVVWIPVSGRSPGEGNGSPLQGSCLETRTDRGAWRGTVLGVAKSQTWLSDWACWQFPVMGQSWALWDDYQHPWFYPVDTNHLHPFS